MRYIAPLALARQLVGFVLSITGGRCNWAAVSVAVEVSIF